MFSIAKKRNRRHLISDTGDPSPLGGASKEGLAEFLISNVLLYMQVSRTPMNMIPAFVGLHFLSPRS